MVVAALFRHDGVPGDMLRRALDGPAVMIHYADALLGKHGDVAVGEEKDFARVLQQRGNVAGNKKFALADADHGRWSHTCRNDLVRVFRRHEHERVDAAQLFQRAAYGFFEWRGLGMLLHQVRDDFGVGFRDELVSLALQLLFELQIVFDNAVVHDNDLAGAVAMRVRVLFGRSAMGGPARVADSVGALDRRFLENFFEIAQFSRRPPHFQLGLVHHRDSRRVISAVFELAQTFNYDGNDFFRPNITDNSAHTRSP